MSKCQISITFDRSDRIYYGGETVRGTVRLLVDEQTKSNGVKLTHRWKTHGRGNSDSGLPDEIILVEPRILQAGEQLEFPFAITSPSHPVTYRGHLVYIDHYVRVDVDVPWAKNPCAEEEYELRPGIRPELFTGERSKVVSLTAQTAETSVGPIGKIILGSILALLLVAVAMTALFLLPIILIVVGFIWVRKKALKSRLGEVEVSVTHVVVAPTEDWTFGIRFTPRKSFVVNSIYAELIAEESATSGSGTNKTTHKHKVLTEKHILREGGLLDPEALVDEKITITFPATNSYSFELSDNSLKWTINFCIDIPSFPDWTHTESLQVVPLEFLGEQARLPNTSAVSSPTALSGSATLPFDRVPAFSPSGVVAPKTTAVQGMSPPALPPDEHWSVSSENTPPESIEELLSLLESAGRNSAQRNLILEAAANEVYDITVVVDRISTSFGITDAAPEFSNGKTVIGQIAGTQRPIEVVAPESMNSELESFRRGDTWQSSVTITGWDSLYNRLRGAVLE
ncbi:MAG: hypothetical protein NT138_20370 [Planctomycetales bacterium]|nr:hypothetical protein [Planctomycetales bacterium]